MFLGLESLARRMNLLFNNKKWVSNDTYKYKFTHTQIHANIYTTYTYRDQAGIVQVNRTIKLVHASTIQKHITEYEKNEINIM